MAKYGNTDGPDRPTDDPQFSEYAEVNEKEGLTGDDFMSSDLNGPESDYEGWNGIDDIPQSGYGALLDTDKRARD